MATVPAGAAAFLSILFALNVLLGVFNLLPVPPLDGFNVLGIFLSDEAGLKLMNLRDSLGAMSIIGLLIAWRYGGEIIIPALFFATSNLLYLPYR